MELHALKLAIAIAVAVVIGTGFLFALYLKLATTGKKASRETRTKAHNLQTTQQVTTMEPETSPSV